MKSPEENLKNMDLHLPSLRPSVGSYVSCMRTGNLLFTAGQGVDQFHGKVGKDLTTEEGYMAAQQSMLNLLAVVKDELGDLERVNKVLKLLVMINSTEDFIEQPSVADGASDLLEKVFLVKGQHARSAVGMAQLPNNTAIEIEMVIEIED